MSDYTISQISNPLELPPYDTLVSTPLDASTAGGVLEFFKGGSQGQKVAVVTVTVANGKRTITRTA